MRLHEYPGTHHERITLRMGHIRKSLAIDLSSVPLLDQELQFPAKLWLLFSSPAHQGAQAENHGMVSQQGRFELQIHEIYPPIQPEQFISLESSQQSRVGILQGASQEKAILTGDDLVGTPGEKSKGLTVIMPTGPHTIAQGTALVTPNQPDRKVDLLRRPTSHPPERLDQPLPLERELALGRHVLQLAASTTSSLGTRGILAYFRALEHALEGSLCQPASLPFQLDGHPFAADASFHEHHLAPGA